MYIWKAIILRNFLGSTSKRFFLAALLVALFSVVTGNSSSRGGLSLSDISYIGSTGCIKTDSDKCVKIPDVLSASDISAYKEVISNKLEAEDAASATHNDILIPEITNNDAGDVCKITKHTDPKSTFRAGISNYRAGNIGTSHRYFARSYELANSVNSASSSAYWAYLSAEKLGNHSKAAEYLLSAVKCNDGFYHTLAASVFADRLMKFYEMPVDRNLDKRDLNKAMASYSWQKIKALTEIGQHDLANKVAAVEVVKTKPDNLAYLKQYLDQLGIEPSSAWNESEFSGLMNHDVYAGYHLPKWKPRGGFEIDPALLFAVMKRESGFSANAVSQKGARGVMQIMPETAEYIVKVTGKSAISGTSLNSPEYNMGLGQNYISYLMDKDNIGKNLVHLLAAYNAGPGNLDKWQRKLGSDIDPLLFIESIPLTETRVYVKSVLHSYWAYREMLGATNSSLTDLAQGDWPMYHFGQEKVASISDYRG